MLGTHHSIIITINVYPAHSKQLWMAWWKTTSTSIFGPKFWFCLLAYTSGLSGVYSRLEVITSGARYPFPNWEHSNGVIITINVYPAHSKQLQMAWNFSSTS
jgi:hypothetical protein